MEGELLMNSMFKSSCFVKVLSLVLIQTFLFSNISFAFDKGHSPQEMLSPMINVGASQMYNVIEEKMSAQKISEKPVWFFGRDQEGNLLTEGNRKMKATLGGKGANIAEMSSINYELNGKTYSIRVPQGFTGTVEEAQAFFDNGNKLSEFHLAEIDRNLAKLEQVTGRTFGKGPKVLLLSCRSGARISMPGMMDTVLNIGLNDKLVDVFAAELTENKKESLGLKQAKEEGEKTAYDSYRRLIQMFSDVVLNLNGEYFEEVMEAKREARGVSSDRELLAEDFKEIVKLFKAYFKAQTGYDFPQSVKEQLLQSYEAVYRSSFTKRVVDYRRINRIPDDTLSAVNVQAMVFGNMNDNSATGVAFTRDPATGEKVFYGEYLINAQGEDVVAGIRTPMPINIANKEQFIKEHPEFIGREAEIISLEEAMPEAYAHLNAIQQKLEEHYKNMQDIEFTIQDGVLYMLQTRDGKRTAFSALKILMAMVDEGMIDKEEAVMRLGPDQLAEFLHPIFDPEAKEQAKKEKRIITKGLNASPGAAVGKVVFSADDAAKWAARGEKVILLRPETVPDDIHGMEAAVGILTSKGGKTSHAAVVARGMGKTAVVGAGDIQIDLSSKRAFVEAGQVEIFEGDLIAIDGYTGEVILGDVATHDSIVKRGKRGEKLNAEEQVIFDMFEKFFEWVDEFRGHIRTNAETAKDLRVAFDWFNADGIGLARTEHMFFEKSRILDIQKAIIGGNIENIQALLPHQKSDFLEMFEICENRQAKIRLIDPPLHEFLPDEKSNDKDKGMPRIELLAQDEKLGMTKEQIIERIHSLEETNSMAGLRGDRLLIMYSAFLDLQIRAMFSAYKEAKEKLQKRGISPAPVQIMIPLVGVAEEADFFIEPIMEMAKEYGLERYKDFKIGTMIEVPSAVVDAYRLGQKLDFFSAGTNDLHQFSFWFDRESAGNVVIPTYMKKMILGRDPFSTVDADGVGEMLAIANALGKKANPELTSGLCGEQGGDAESITETIYPAGLDYPSCSPFRLPVAMLASAQANIRAKRSGKPLAKKYDLSEIEKKVSLEDIPRVDVQSTDEMMVNNQRKRVLMRQLLITEKGSEDEAEAAAQQEQIDKIEARLANTIQNEMKAILENDNNAFIRLHSQDLGSLFQFSKKIDKAGNLVVTSAKGIRYIVDINSMVDAFQNGTDKYNTPSDVFDLFKGFVTPLDDGEAAEVQEEPEAIMALYHLMHSEIEDIKDYETKNQAKKRVLNSMKEKMKSFGELNPSLGNRGVRAMLTNSPEIARTQIKALSNVLKENRDYAPRIIVSLLINEQEFKQAKEMLIKWLKEEGIDPARVQIGASIQTPESAIFAGRIAEYADFIIFDTEGLTESVIAVTKQDSKTFMDKFVALGIYDVNPFELLSEKNVGKFMGIAKSRVLKTNPDMPIYLSGSVLMRSESAFYEAGLKQGMQDVLRSDKAAVEKVDKAI
jgi:pyruvate,orthophosphate dikinase